MEWSETLEESFPALAEAWQTKGRGVIGRPRSKFAEQEDMLDPEPETKIILDRNPAETSLEDWTVESKNFSRDKADEVEHEAVEAPFT